MNKKLLLILAITMVIASSASAQLIFGGQASYLSGSPNAGSQFGMGAQAKIKVGNRVAVGGTLRGWLKKESTIGTGGMTVVAGDAMSNLAGMLEIYLSKSAIQPYIGTDAGLYFTNIKTSVSSNGGSVNQENKKTYFGVAPKFGIQFNTGLISPFVQAQYHWLFGGGNEIQVPDLLQNPKSYDKFFTLDAGILLQIGKVGGKK
jgi:hypothetical protein